MRRGATLLKTNLQTCAKCGAALTPMPFGPQCPVCFFDVLTAEAPAAPAGSRSFGEYELLEELGRGGMGVVYRAWQPALQRSVALKMLLAGPLASPEFIERFRREALAAARLHHPGIAAVLDAGECDGQAYYTMELIEGRTLGALVREGLPPVREAAALVEKTARAVAHAHAQGVLHRDLKPSNILLTAEGEPRVADFGLARMIRDADVPEGALTLSTAMLGSPPYMAPEQAEGRASGPASDIYALGAVLYELLTGRPPHQGSSPQEILIHVREAAVVEPRRLNPSLPRDLETVCLKCLEREPSRRYSTAGAFADDLARFLNGEPVVVRPVSAAGRLLRWCRRRPALASALALAVLALASAAVVSAVASGRMRRAAQSARAAEREARARLRESLIEQARARLLTGEAGRRFTTLELLRRANDIAPSPETGTLATHALAHSDLELRREWDWREEGGRYPVMDAAHNTLAVLHDDGRATLRRVEEGAVLHTITGIPGGFREQPALSPDGSLIAIRGADFRLRVFNWKDSACLLETVSPGVSRFGGAPGEAPALVFLDEHRCVRRWAAGDAAPSAPWPGIQSAMAPVLTSDGGRAALVVHGRRELVVADARTGAVQWRSPLPEEMDVVYSMCWHPDMRHLAVTGPDGVAVLDTLEGRVVSAWETVGRSALEAAFSPDGMYLATIGWSPLLRLYDWRRAGLVLTAPRNGERVGFSSDGSSVFTDHSGNQVSSLWKFSTGSGWRVLTRVAPPRAAAGRAFRGILAFDSGGRYLVNGNAGTVEWRRADTGTLLAAVPAGEVLAVAFQPGGDLFAGTRRGILRIPWREENGTLQTGPVRSVWTAHNACLLSFSADGRRAAAWSFGWEQSWTEQRLRVFDTANWNVVATSGEFESEPRRPQWSPDGRWIADHCWRGPLPAVWDAASGAVVWQGEPATSLTGPRWTPEGDLFCPEQPGQVFEGGTWRKLPAGPPSPADEAYVSAMEFAPGGHFFAVALPKGLVRLVSWPERQVIAEVRTLNGVDVQGMQFAPDGRRLAMVDAAQSVILWDLAGSGAAQLAAGLTSPLQRLEFHGPAAPPRPWPLHAAVETVSPAECAARRAAAAAHLIARDPRTPPGCLDLRPLYNTALAQPLPLEPGTAGGDAWHCGALMPGALLTATVPFDAGGLMILNSGQWLPFAPDWPERSGAITVQRAAERIHLLLGCAGTARDGETIASLTILRADATRLEVPLRAGRELDGSVLPHGTPPRLDAASAVAWQAECESGGRTTTVRLYRHTLVNPEPGVPVQSLEFRSTMSHGALVVAGVTIE